MCRCIGAPSLDIARSVVFGVSLRALSSLSARRIYRHLTPHLSRRKKTGASIASDTALSRSQLSPPLTRFGISDAAVDLPHTDLLIGNTRPDQETRRREWEREKRGGFSLLRVSFTSGNVLFSLVAARLDFGACNNPGGGAERVLWRRRWSAPSRVCKTPHRFASRRGAVQRGAVMFR